LFGRRVLHLLGLRRRQLRGIQARYVLVEGSSEPDRNRAQDRSQDNSVVLPSSGLAQVHYLLPDMLRDRKASAGTLSCLDQWDMLLLYQFRVP